MNNKELYTLVFLDMINKITKEFKQQNKSKFDDKGRDLVYLEALKRLK